MKKPALAALGLVGACAACCAIPIALPLLGGLSAIGLTGIGFGTLGAGGGVMVGAAALAFAAICGFVLWRRQRRNAAAACSVEDAFGVEGPAAAKCGCAGSASTATPEGCR